MATAISEPWERDPASAPSRGAWSAAQRGDGRSPRARGARRRRSGSSRGAALPAEIGTTPESAGLWAISQGFTDVASDDAEIVEPAAFLYDSLYAHLRRRLPEVVDADEEGGR